MVGDAEMSLDQHDDAVGGPEFGAPAVGLGPPCKSNSSSRSS
jgi:hypothetical protein